MFSDAPGIDYLSPLFGLVSVSLPTSCQLISRGGAGLLRNGYKNLTLTLMTQLTFELKIQPVYRLV